MMVRGLLMGAAIALLAPGVAAAADRADFVLDMGTREQGAGAALRLDVVLRHPDDPNAKPPPITGATYRLPAGTRIDTAAVTRCAATDDEIRAVGPSACPADSRVGGGTLTAMTGFGPPTDPLAGDIHAFNADGQIIEVVTAPGTDRVAGIDRLTVAGSTLTAHPPMTPGGPPDGQTSIREVHLLVDRPGYATAPPTCPIAGRWSYGATAQFADGGTGVVSGTLACARELVPLRLTAEPRRIRAGRSSTVRFVVQSSDPDCVSGAAVRFIGRRVVTDARGVATIRTTPARAGRRRASVAKPGCRPARTSVRVLRG
jgi:hypothetical protein